MITVSLSRYTSCIEFHEALDQIYEGIHDSRNIAVLENDALVIRMASSEERTILKDKTKNTLQTACETLFQNNDFFLHSKTLHTLKKWWEISTLPFAWSYQKVVAAIFERQKKSLPAQSRARAIEKKRFEQIQDRQSRAFDCLNRMRKTTEDGDLEFLFAEGSSTRAHLSVLCAQLSFFAAKKTMHQNRNPTKPISSAHPLQFDCSKIPSSISREEMERFLDFHYGCNWPPSFDSSRLFHFANYIQDNALIEAIIFSQLHRSFNHAVLTTALSQTMKSFSPQKNTLIEIYIDWSEQWHEVVHESIIQNWEWLPKNYLIAKMFLFNCYKKGICIPQNREKAFQLIHSLALQKNPWAQAHLGNFYATGYGVGKNEKTASEWFIKSVNQQHPYGLAALALMQLKNNRLEEAFHLFRLSAIQGYPSGLIGLADFYENFSTPPDLDSAIQYYAKAAPWIPFAKERLEALTKRAE